MQLDAFLSATFAHRESTVRVEGLADFFDEEPEWIVRGMSAGELLKCNSASETQKNLATAIEALAGSVGKDKVPATRKLLGLEGVADAEMAKRLEMLVIGSVKPEIGLDAAVKLGHSFPVEFMQLTNEIMKLTSEGADTVKRKPSGKTPK